MSDQQRYRMRVSAGTAFLLLTVFGLALLGSGYDRVASTPGGTAAPPGVVTVTPVLGPDNLVGKPLGMVAERALRILQHEGRLRSGIPEVVLLRPVTRDDLPALGLGCLPPQYTYEDPPRVLVILRGDFLTFDHSGTPRSNKYVSYIFDLWVGWPMDEVYSVDGRHFRKALDDPSLPYDAGVYQVYTCPTANAVRHYGETYTGTPTMAVFLPTAPPLAPSPDVTSTGIWTTPAPTPNPTGAPTVAPPSE